MALVGYSDSEGSSDEKPKTTPKPSVSKAAPAKAAPPKLIDRSNPHKIRVNLPESSAPKLDNIKQDEDRPAKRAKTAGSFGGFNAMLPAPKRTGKPPSGSSSKGTGLGRGVNLKTSSEVGFSREPMPESTPSAEKEKDEPQSGNGAADIEKPAEQAVAASIEKPAQEPKVVGNPMMFKPLSVARKPQKKKKPSSALFFLIIMGTT